MLDVFKEKWGYEMERYYEFDREECIKAMNDWYRKGTKYSFVKVLIPKGSPFYQKFIKF